MSQVSANQAGCGAWAQQQRQRVDAELEQALCLPAAGAERLRQAMAYAVTGGGKRMRPLLAYAGAEALGVPVASVDAAAVAVELIHAYSLVHDDLPAMDDDDLRRGQPTCHIAFDEATAILAGDGLQTLAFQVLAQAALPAEAVVAMTALLADTAGANGMVGGQALDLEAEGKQVSLEHLENIHLSKTGALIRASILFASCLPGAATAQQRAALEQFAQAAGLAFQVADDVLDVEGDTAQLGKTAGADQARDKSTYPALLGLEQAKALRDQLYQQALKALEPFGGKASLLAWLAEQIVVRQS